METKLQASFIPIQEKIFQSVNSFEKAVKEQDELKKIQQEYREHPERFHTYKLVMLNSDGSLAGVITDNKLPIMRDFEQMAIVSGQTYLWEQHKKNPYNKNVSVQGYYFDGVYLRGGYPLKTHFQYYYKPEEV